MKRKKEFIFLYAKKFFSAFYKNLSITKILCKISKQNKIRIEGKNCPYDV